MLNLMKRYTSAFSVTGSENELAEMIKVDIAPYVDEITTDALGSVIALKKGLSSEKRLMISAHIDEIGFIVTYIEDSGMIRVSNLGGINAIACAFSKVKFANGQYGVISPEGNTKPADLAVKKLIVDIGAKTKKEAQKKVRVGDVCALVPSFQRLMNNRYAAKAFDDRIGCAVAVQAAKNIAKAAYDTYFVFNVQEEVGLRGSKPAAFAIQPTYSIAIDVTATGDTIGATPMAVKLGDGAAIKIKDNSLICSKLIVDGLTKHAKSNGIKHQYEVLEFGGTDAASMQTAAAGSYAGVISIPTRYIHSAVETVDMNDVKECARLLTVAVEEGFEA